MALLDFKKKGQEILNSFEKAKNFISFNDFKEEMVKILSQKTAKKLDIIFYEKDYMIYAGDFIKILKNYNVEYTVLLVDDDKNLYNSNVINAINKPYVIVVGDCDLIKATNYICSQKNIDCYAFLTSPYFDELFLNKYNIIYNNKFKTLEVKTIDKLVIDKYLINKCNKKDVLTSYTYNLLNAITLIDYRLLVMLYNYKFNETEYNLLKQSFQMALNFSSYGNMSEVMCLCSVISNVLQLEGEILNNNVVKKAVDIILLNDTTNDLAYIYIKCLEKFIKLYHLFYTNDFEGVISVASIVSDIEKASILTGISEEKLYKNLKIPSKKRIDLIFALLNKVKDNFAKETTSLMAILPKIEEGFYKNAQNVIKGKGIDNDNLKNAITYSPYLISEYSTLTLMRDFGLLNL